MAENAENAEKREPESWINRIELMVALVLQISILVITVSALIRGQWLVVQQGRFDGFRATRMIQDKAQSAGNGMSFSRTVTPYWIIRVAPFGRVVKRSSAVLRLLARTRH